MAHPVLLPHLPPPAEEDENGEAWPLRCAEGDWGLCHGPTAAFLGLGGLMWVIHTWSLGASDLGWPHTWAAGIQVDAGPELSSASSVQGRSWEGRREGVGQGVSPGPMPLGQHLVAYTWPQGHPQTFLLSPGLSTDLCVTGDSKRASLQEFKVMTNRGNHREFQEDPARKNQEVKLKSQVSDLYGPQISLHPRLLSSQEE